MLFLKSRDVTGNWRFEYKYKLPLALYRQVRHSLVPYTEPDDYTRAAIGKAYLVRSLYYDTDDFRAYHEKIGGDYGRTKLRIRTYGSELSGDSVIRVELKTRRGPPMEKFSTFVSADSYAAFMQTRHWPEIGNAVLAEFERLVHLRALRPKLLVEYSREGLKPRSREDLRITFDHRVQSASATSLFPDHIYLRDHHRHETILEVKCRNEQPTWLAKLIKLHGLKPMANSKYTRGIEISRHDVVTPMWTQGYLEAKPFVSSITTALPHKPIAPLS